ncbi:MAG: hypothetical protein HRT89_09985, partial [Lentisphaeria bacterium]|nr:hypothetical protein [Lentisphaeria bacterium]NQZ68390.1 hypothetical protein [Lentisphaeria bacterium]
VFTAGPDAEDHNCHAVLWSKKSFAGTMKVSFEFTRLDSINRFVNIIYFQANGTGEGPYQKDIHAWQELRKTPFMKTYFENMDLLHVSFAAFGNDNDDPEDYIRVRRYPVRQDRSFDQIEVEPTIFNTDLFLPNKTVELCFIKTQNDLALEITGGESPFYHHWDLSGVDPTFNGPIGIRQMWQKCSKYKNIKIFTA